MISGEILLISHDQRPAVQLDNMQNITAQKNHASPNSNSAGAESLGVHLEVAAPHCITSQASSSTSHADSVTHRRALCEGLDLMPHFPLRGDCGLWLELPSRSQSQLWLSYAAWRASSEVCLPCLCFVTLPFAPHLLCDALHTWFSSPKRSDAAHSKAPRTCKLPLSSLSLS